MERIEAELFTDGGNDAVVRLPGRRFPGVLVQGDSLHILRSDVAEVVEACERGDLDEARDSMRPSSGEPGCSAGAVRGSVERARDSTAVLSCRAINLGNCGHLLPGWSLTWAKARGAATTGLAAFTVVPRCSPPDLVGSAGLQIHTCFIVAPPEKDVRWPERQTAQSRLQDLEQSIGIGSVGVHDGFASSELVPVDLPDASLLGRCIHHLLSVVDPLALVGVAEAVTGKLEVCDDSVLLVSAFRGNGCLHAGHTVIEV